MKKKILMVGEHPFSTTGNGNMLRGLLSNIDFQKFDVTAFVVNLIQPWEEPDASSLPYRIVTAADWRDPWGEKRLVQFLANAAFDVVLMVGLDIWRYPKARGYIQTIRDRKQFKWGWIFPYDLMTVRKDWLEWIKLLDFPCVYSLYGYELLEDHVENLSYFRPPLAEHELFRPLSPREKASKRTTLFPTISQDAVLFGFVGNNQIRKNPLRMLRAFAELAREHSNVFLNLHTDINDSGDGYNLYQYMLDLGLKTGQILVKTDKLYTRQVMADIFGCLDCLVNCSMQEGLSWTPLESMLCGTPVIVSESTAHIELVEGAGWLVPANVVDYIPLSTGNGRSHIESRACAYEDILDAMESMLEPDLRTIYAEDCLARGQKWLKGVSDINALLHDMTERSAVECPITPRKAVLFAQHSSAGDVFMTTRCFKGIKERHPDLPLVYMTSPQYMNIIEGNPYVEEVIPWDDKLLGQFEYTYNPHGDRIAPGHWGRNSNSLLSDFYWKILMVEPDNFFIHKKRPEDLQGIRFFEHRTLSNGRWVADMQDVVVDKHCIVHTTGGDPAFRTYKYMADVCEGLRDRYVTIQVGGAKDYPAGADIDLRGKLTFQETAWLMDKAVLAVTVDSFVSHLAGALGVSQVCLFGSGNVFVVRPNQMKGELICLAPDYVRDCKGLGPCSASVRDCPTPCTSIHSPGDIMRAIHRIEQHGNVRRNCEHEESRYSIQFPE